MSEIGYVIGDDNLLKNEFFKNVKFPANEQQNLLRLQPRKIFQRNVAYNYTKKAYFINFIL